jgi:tyrosine-protein phosphatase YwqE
LLTHEKNRIFSSFLGNIANNEEKTIFCRIHKLKELVAMGALVQLNSLSFYGVFGRNAKHAAEIIVKKGLAQFIATTAIPPGPDRHDSRKCRKCCPQAS